MSDCGCDKPIKYIVMAPEFYETLRELIAAHGEDAIIEMVKTFARFGHE